MAAADGSWELKILITDLNVDQTIRSRGDMHVGGLMLKIVNAVEMDGKDWSDHALWWPDNKTWLVRTRWILDKYGVSGNTTLWFTPMHKNLRITLPDLQTIELRLNFSVNVFNNVIALCKKFKIRHPEELSLTRTTSRTSNRRSVQHIPGRDKSNNAAAATDPDAVSTDLKGSDTASADIMLGRSMDNLFDANDTALPHIGSQTASLDSLVTGLSTLSCSPLVPVREAVSLLTKPQNYSDKAAIDARWLDSSKSLMEQDVDENDRVMLRYKFCTFFDLKPKYDSVRINQIYEQAKWSIITEHVDCTEEEMVLFAGLQLHIQQKQYDEDEMMLTPGSKTHSTENIATDDVDAALDDLQMNLTGEDTDTKPGALLNKCPELRGYHLVYQRKKMAMKRYKIRYFTLIDTELNMFHDAEHLKHPLSTLDVKGCEVSGLAKMSEKKFTIQLIVRYENSPTELLLKLDNPEQYAAWLAAFRIASRHRTMADVAYNNEVQSILHLLRLRQPAGHLELDKRSCANIDPENFAAATCVRKVGRRQMTKRIVEARCNVQNMTSVEAKMTYIKAWQRLAASGTAYFIVMFKGSKKKELVAVGPERVARLDSSTGHCLQTWSYDMMTSWSVNWTTEQLKVELCGDDGDHEVAFQCLSADCKVVHEFIGGYVFVSMRSLDKSQTLNEELFQKLTGGWH